MNKLTRKHRGFFIAEVVAGLALLALLMTMLAVALGQRQKAMNRLADSRAALRLAEAALSAMQNKTPLTGAGSGSSLSVMKLSAPCEAQGFVWAQVNTTFNGRSATLVGIVPAASIPKEGGS